MSKRIGLFVDVSNLYYCIGKKFGQKKLDYHTYYKFVKDLGEISVALAYGSHMNGQADGFIHCLRSMGFQTKFKAPKTYKVGDNEALKRKADWDVGITIDIVNMIDRLDMIVLGTADGDMVPVVEWALAKGVDVVIIATGISKDLRDIATKSIEIPESFLESTRAPASAPADASNKE